MSLAAGLVRQYYAASPAARKKAAEAKAERASAPPQPNLLPDRVTLSHGDLPQVRQGAYGCQPSWARVASSRKLPKNPVYIPPFTTPLLAGGTR